MLKDLSAADSSFPPVDDAVSAGGQRMPLVMIGAMTALEPVVCAS